MSARTGLVRIARMASLLALPVFIAVAPVPLQRDGDPFRAAYAASARRGKGAKAAKDFDYTVSDCRPAGEPDAIRLELSPGAVGFVQTLRMNCTAATRPHTVKLSYAKKGRDLEVTITLRSDVLADCTCPIGIEGRITNLAKGAYHLSIIYEEKAESAANEKGARRTVATQEFSIE